MEPEIVFAYGVLVGILLTLAAVCVVIGVWQATRADVPQLTNGAPDWSGDDL